MKRAFCSLILLLGLTVSGFAQTEPGSETNNPPAEAQASTDTDSTSTDSETPAEPERRELGEVVLFGENFTLAANETAREIVVIGGNVTIHGEVRNSLVVVGGNATISGKVRELILVGGRGDLSGSVQSFMVVGGGAAFSPTAVVERETIVIGGHADVAPGANVRTIQNIGLPRGFGPVGDFFEQYIQQAIFKLRPFAIAPAVVVVALGILFFYFLIALVFARPVSSSVKVMEARPAMSFVAGLLALIALAPLIFVLIFSVIGIVLIPFLFAALVALCIFGKVVVSAAIGNQIPPRGEHGALGHPAFALLKGAFILALLYLIPIIGFLAWALVSVMGLGAVVLAISTALVKERPVAPNGSRPPGRPATFTSAPQAYAAAPRVMTSNAAPVSNVSPVAPATVASVPVQGGAGSMAFSAEAGGGTAVLTESADVPPVTSAAYAAMPPSSSSASASTSTAPLGAAAVVAQPEALLYERAGFWRRLMAGLLDFVICAVLVGILPFTAPALPLVVIAFQVALWAWRGTTVGGVVLSLKVVRLDGQSMNFPTALVRGLASLFSGLIFGIGYMWVAWDNERQSWHDKIAGTTVVIMPNGVSLM